MKIAHCVPRQRGKVNLSNLEVLDAVLYVADYGCKWCSLPKRFDNWHTIYTRMNRCFKAGVMDRVFEELQFSPIVRITVETVSLDITLCEVRPYETGTFKNRRAIQQKTARRLIHQNSFGCGE